MSETIVIFRKDETGDRGVKHETCDQPCLACDFAVRLSHRRRLLILIDDLVASGEIR